MKTFTLKLIFIVPVIMLNACMTTEVDLHSKVNLPSRFEQIKQDEAHTDIAQWWKK